MRCILIVVFISLFNIKSTAQAGVTIHVSGRYILGPCNDTIILKGVNYAPYNWGWSPTQLNINQIALSGANCVRMPWYVNSPDGPTPQATYNNLVYLDSALAKCVQNKMIPILELSDLTCTNNPASLISLANWFVTPAVKLLINKYKHSIIINIANEALWVSWASNPTTAQSTFSNTYGTIVNTIRSNSITVPIMIDAPDCGTNLDVLSNVGQVMQAADPLNNLIFSAHAYWYTYANNDSLQALGKINYAISKNIPIVFGEVSNLQDGASMCQYTLNYKPWIKILKQKKIGWMAWSWDNDGCTARRMSTNGNFNSLTTFGNDIVNNPIYGLSIGTIKSSYLLNNYSCPPPTPTLNFTIPTPVCVGANFTLTNTSVGALNYTWTILGGIPATSNATNAITSYSAAGIYSITLLGANGNSTVSITKTLTANSFPSLTINTPTVCAYSSATLTASGAASYTWINGPNSSSIIASPSVTTIYTVTGSNGVCFTSKTATIVAKTNPTVSINNQTICPAGTATLTANGAASYSWSTSFSGNPLMVSPSTNTTYSVTGTTNGCKHTKTVSVTVGSSLSIFINTNPVNKCASGSATLTASGANNYTWTPSSSNASSIVVNQSTTTNYTVVGNSGSCNGSATTTVNVIPTPTFALVVNPSKTICAGKSATLTASGYYSTYTWISPTVTASFYTVAPASTTSYTVFANGVGGCNTSSVVTITIKSNPITTVSYTNANCTSSCSGMVTGTTTAGSPPFTYSLTGGSSTVFPNSSLCSGNYTLLTNDAFGCTTSNSFSINAPLNNLISSISTTNASCGTCSNGIIEVFASGGIGPYTYNWIPNGGTNSVANNLVPECYTVTITDANGCSITSTTCVGSTTQLKGTLINYLQILVYPNPAKDCVTIEYPGSIFNFKLFNSLGQLILSDENIRSKTILNLSELDQGIYLVEVEVGINKVRKKLIIK